MDIVGVSLRLGLDADSMPVTCSATVLFLFFKDFIFRERGREGEREGKKHQCVVAFHAPPTRELARNTVMCPDRELNQ